MISLSLPRLRHITTDILIDSEKELSVKLPFERVRAVQLRGKIKRQAPSPMSYRILASVIVLTMPSRSSAEFPNLKNWSSTIAVDSDVAFDGDEFVAGLKTAHEDHLPGKVDCYSPTS